MSFDSGGAIASVAKGGIVMKKVDQQPTASACARFACVFGIVGVRAAEVS
jgi:hypothetical protein